MTTIQQLRASLVRAHNDLGGNYHPSYVMHDLRDALALLDRLEEEQDDLAPRLSAEEFHAVQTAAKEACGGPGPQPNDAPFLSLFDPEVKALAARHNKALEEAGIEPLPEGVIESLIVLEQLPDDVYAANVRTALKDPAK